MDAQTTKCTVCGAPLTVDGSCRNVVCQYCGATVVIADFEQLRSAEVSANAQIVQDRLNQDVANKKRERIEQLETALHAAEESFKQTKQSAGIVTFFVFLFLLLGFVASWLFFVIMIVLLCVLSGIRSGLVTKNAQVAELRRQLDSLIR